MIKRNLAKYVLFVYESYLLEDWDEMTKTGKRILIPFWYIRVLYITLYGLTGLPLIHMFLKNSKFWNEFVDFVKQELQYINLIK